MITLKNIAVSIDDKQILDGISCSAKPGDFVIIVGTNGAGKTTLFDTIAGKVRLTSGSIIIDDQDVTPLGEQQRAQVISRLAQNPLHHCVADMTIAENVALALLKGHRAGLRTAVNEQVHTIVHDIAATFGFDAAPFARTAMGSLSGGQRQVIALVMATLVKPKLLLLDEPTAALDPQAATKMLHFTLRYIKQHQLTTLLITHDPRLALAIGNKIWVLDKGRIVKQIDKSNAADISPADLIGHIDYDAIIKIQQ